MNSNSELAPVSKSVALKSGQKYSLCSCGKSKKLPFCDDSHKIINAEKGTSYKPVKIWPEKDVTVEVFCGNWETVTEK